MSSAPRGAGDGDGAGGRLASRASIAFGSRPASGEELHELGVGLHRGRQGGRGRCGQHGRARSSASRAARSCDTLAEERLDLRLAADGRGGGPAARRARASSPGSSCPRACRPSQPSASARGSIFGGAVEGGEHCAASDLVGPWPWGSRGREHFQRSQTWIGGDIHAGKSTHTRGGLSTERAPGHRTGVRHGDDRRLDEVAVAQHRHLSACGPAAPAWVEAAADRRSDRASADTAPTRAPASAGGWRPS